MCADNADCGEGSGSCVDLICTLVSYENPGGDCVDDGDCGQGQGTCALGLCAADSNMNANGTCDADADCGSGSCVVGIANLSVAPGYAGTPTVDCDEDVDTLKNRFRLMSGAPAVDAGIVAVRVFVEGPNDDGIPSVWLQDVSGFDIGVEAEKLGF